MREFQLEEKVKKKKHFNINQHFLNIILELLND